MSVENLMQTVKKSIAAAATAVFGHTPDRIELVFPPKVQMGDIAVACFEWAKQFKQSPARIAQKIGAHIQPDDTIKSATPVGPYLNITLDTDLLFRKTCLDIIDETDAYGSSEQGRGRRVMTEYLSPNTNKPLHLGHLRNGALGMAVSNLFTATGHDVVKANLVNNRGVHICKSMLAWQRWGQGATPESEGMKGDHFVGKWYVRYALEAEKDPRLEREVQAMLQDWEAGRSKTVNLWETMNNWVYDGFDQTCRRFRLEFDIIYYESDTYRLGRNIVMDGLQRGVFTRDENDNTVFFLPEKAFGTDKDGEPKRVTIMRPDGTSLYITQDIGTSVLKVEEQGLDFSIWVVGSEQEHHFKCLFQILDSLGYAWAKDCYHLSYGMVYLPEGKMKSREGKIVDADDLIEAMHQLAVEEIRKRDPANQLSPRERNRRAAKISVGALKFYLLRVRPTQSIHFDPKESISFDGFTGPYCQYAYARIHGILAKAAATTGHIRDADFASLGNEEERLLLQKLIQFPKEIQTAVNELNPSRIATHAFQTAKAFNQFYNKHSVLQADTKELVAARLALIRATAIVLKNGLNLMGIEVLENM